MTKSPVHSGGRNQKHRRGKKHASSGNVNMQGKKEQRMPCMCCDCIDFRDRELKKEHDKEMSHYMKEVNDTG